MRVRREYATHTHTRTHAHACFKTCVLGIHTHLPGMYWWQWCCRMILRNAKKERRGVPTAQQSPNQTTSAGASNLQSGRTQNKKSAPSDAFSHSPLSLSLFRSDSFTLHSLPCSQSRSLCLDIWRSGEGAQIYREQEESFKIRQRELAFITATTASLQQ